MNSQKIKLNMLIKNKVISSLSTAVISLSLMCFQVTAFAKTEYISIGTGGVNGVYYPTGGAICYLANKVTGVDSMHCEVKSTPGSIYNLKSIQSGEIDLGVVQSDWQYHAYNGSSRFKSNGKFTELRSLFSVHAEPFTVLAREDANINSFEDIKGKRVNFGAPNSGQRATMDILLGLYGWSDADFSKVTSMNPSEQAQALCDKKVDVIVYVVGHPNSSIKEATSACQTKLVNVKSAKLDSLIAKRSYYDTAVIPANMYRGSPNETHTFGVGATIVATTRLPEHVAYEIVKTVFENHQAFTQLHPAFTNLTQKAMVTQYLSAPLHPGAIRYYKEVGLIKDESQVEAKTIELKKLNTVSE